LEVNRLQIENANLKNNPQGSEGSNQRKFYQRDSIKEPFTNYNKTDEEGSTTSDSSSKPPDSDSRKNAKHKGNHPIKVKEQDHEKPQKKTSNKDNTLFDSNKE
jgi:hypothetical protein